MNKIMHKLKKFSNYSLGDKIFVISTYAVLLVIAFICLYPLYFVLIASVSDPYAVYRGEVFWKPVGFTLEAYEYVMQNSSIWLGYANSIFYTVITTILHLVIVVPFGYALSRRHVIGYNVIMNFLLISMYFGGGMIPAYILYTQLHLVNTRLLIILLGSMSVWNGLLCRTYFSNNVSESLYEAARMDGAGEFTCFFRVALPLAGPILAVIALYAAVSQWSGYWNAMIYLRDSDKAPLQLVLRQILILNQQAYSDAMESGNIDAIESSERLQYMATTMKFSLVLISSLPMLIAYPFVQKHFVKGVMIGSVKG